MLFIFSVNSVANSIFQDNVGTSTRRIHVIQAAGIVVFGGSRVAGRASADRFDKLRTGVSFEADAAGAAVSGGRPHRFLVTAGIEPLLSTPQQFGSFIQTETVRYAKVIRDAGIKAE